MCLFKLLLFVRSVFLGAVVISSVFAVVILPRCSSGLRSISLWMLLVQPRPEDAAPANGATLPERHGCCQVSGSWPKSGAGRVPRLMRRPSTFIDPRSSEVPSHSSAPLPDSKLLSKWFWLLFHSWENFLQNAHVNKFMLLNSSLLKCLLALFEYEHNLT